MEGRGGLAAAPPRPATPRPTRRPHPIPARPARPAQSTRAGQLLCQAEMNLL